MKKLAVILCAMLAFAPVPRAAAQVHVREMPETAFGFFQEIGRALSESSEYDGEGGQFEFEPSFGLSLPFYGGGLKGMAGASGGIEIRYNVPDKPTDVGVELNYTVTARHASDVKGLFNRSSSYCEFNAASVAVICDYNLEFGDGGVVPFIGVGGGLSKRTYAAKNPDYIHQDRPDRRRAVPPSAPDPRRQDLRPRLQRHLPPHRLRHRRRPQPVKAACEKR